MYGLVSIPAVINYHDIIINKFNINYNKYCLICEILIIGSEIFQKWGHDL